MAVQGAGSTPTLPDNGTPTSLGATFRKFALDHPTLLVSMVAALIFAVRCVVVTGGNSYTASILLAQTSLGDAIRALLFSILPGLPLLGCTIFGFWAGYIAWQAKRNGAWQATILMKAIGLIAGAVIALLLSAYVTEEFFWFVSLFITIMSFAWGAIISYFGGLEGLRSIRRRMAAVVFLLLLFPGVIIWGVSIIRDAEFWLPRERIDFQYEEPFTGYVLKMSEDYLVILRDKPRVIVEKKKKLLEDRDFCYPEDHPARSSKVKSDAPTCP
jgi:hypothetical protein